MALVSPGIEISINDQSQYVNSSSGSVPLVVLATASNKTYNGSVAAGTTSAYAGQLQTFTSQRDLVTSLGTPVFQVSEAGTPLHGSEINEYGLMTAYSALGISNQLYAIRADIDLGQLEGTSVRPTGPEADGTFWMDLTNSQFGIYSLDSVNAVFDSEAPLLITDPTEVSNDGNFSFPVPTPLSSVGNQGQYALVFVNTTSSIAAYGEYASAVRLFYKATSNTNSSALTNTWVQVGSTNWQNSLPTVTGTVTTNPSIPSGANLVINGTSVGTLGSTISSMATAINNAAITGVTAAVTGSNQLTFFVTSAANSGAGTMTLLDGVHTPLALCGVLSQTGTAIPTTGTPTTFYAPYLFYGNFAQTPSGGWFSTDTQPRPSGSIWWKTTATGGGFNLVVNEYNAATNTWNADAVPAYSTFSSTLYGLDPSGGGLNISAGQLVAQYVSSDGTSNALRIYDHKVAGQTVATGGVITSTFTTGDQFTIQATAPGGTTFTSYTLTIGADTSAKGFVSTILAKNIPFVTASYNSTANTITITHTAGGQIQLTNGTYSVTPPLTTAGFITGEGSGFNVGTISPYSVYITNFSNVTNSIIYDLTQPYGNPESGTYWYYSNPADLDIMVNNYGWKGYRNVTSDVRGYNLSQTDVNGVIISAGVAPTTQSNGVTAVVAGDLWLDSGDLANFPALYRYTGTNWVSINNEDHISQNGIIFADARWGTSGSIDPISSPLPIISDGTSTGLLFSNYIDQDAPDYRLYPRGTILFNTRRSGFNVKKFVANYFNSASFPTPGAIPGSSNSLPVVANSWVSASGNDANGVMYAGSAAQRALVVAAMQGAVDSNTDVLESIYSFNLLVAPNYPELIPNLITLNDNRGDTGFVIGDTPMSLQPTVTALTAWSNNTNGTGLATASPYLAVYYPAGLTNDLAGNQIAVPASHAVLRTYMNSDNMSHPWFAPAGTTRGLVSNLSDIGYIDTASGSFVHNGINQGLRDALYTLNINPITQLPGTGLVVWGQETRSGDTTSRNRVNVVRLENYLRTIFNTISNGFLFEPNDTITRKSIATQIEGALNSIVAQRGIYDYLVICDTSNNTPSIIANNQLYVDVAIEPMKDVEFIYIPIALYNPGTIAALGTSST